MDVPLRELDLVAVLDPPPESGVKRGWVGAIVLVHDEHQVEVEFVDAAGVAKVLTPLPAQNLLRLEYNGPSTAAA